MYTVQPFHPGKTTVQKNHSKHIIKITAIFMPVMNVCKHNCISKHLTSFVSFKLFLSVFMLYELKPGILAWYHLSLSNWLSCSIKSSNNKHICNCPSTHSVSVHQITFRWKMITTVQKANKFLFYTPRHINLLRLHFQHKLLWTPYRLEIKEVSWTSCCFWQGVIHVRLCHNDTLHVLHPPQLTRYFDISMKW